MTGDQDVCRIMEVDGTTIRLRGNGQPLTSTDIEALAELVRAVRAIPDAEREARYAAGQKRIRERNARLANPDREGQPMTGKHAQLEDGTNDGPNDAEAEWFKRGWDAARPRLLSCIEQWPGCIEGEYNPSCCRFPKSCSCTVYGDDIPREMLEADQ